MTDLTETKQADSNRVARLKKYCGIGWRGPVSPVDCRKTAELLASGDEDKIRDWCLKLIYRWDSRAYDMEATEKKILRICLWLIDSHSKLTYSHQTKEYAFVFMTELTNYAKYISGLPGYELEEDCLGELLIFYSGLYGKRKNDK